MLRCIIASNGLEEGSWFAGKEPQSCFYINTVYLVLADSSRGIIYDHAGDLLH